MAVDRSLITIHDDESGHYEKIEGMSPKGMIVNCCPFCDGHIQGGSWTPDTCVDCGAVYFFNAWTRDIKLNI